MRNVLLGFSARPQLLLEQHSGSVDEQPHRGRLVVCDGCRAARVGAQLSDWQREREQQQLPPAALLDAALSGSAHLELAARRVRHARALPLPDHARARRRLGARPARAGARVCRLAALALAVSRRAAQPRGLVAQVLLRLGGTLPEPQAARCVTLRPVRDSEPREALVAPDLFFVADVRLLSSSRRGHPAHLRARAAERRARGGLHCHLQLASAHLMPDAREGRRAPRAVGHPIARARRVPLAASVVSERRDRRAVQADAGERVEAERCHQRSRRQECERLRGRERFASGSSALRLLQQQQPRTQVHNPRRRPETHARHCSS